MACQLCHFYILIDHKITKGLCSQISSERSQPFSSSATLYVALTHCFTSFLKRQTLLAECKPSFVVSPFPSNLIRQLNHMDKLTKPRTQSDCFSQLHDEITEAYQENLPQECWKQLPADDLLYLFTLGVFVVVMGHCCRGWDGNRKQQQQNSLLSATHLAVDRGGTGSWVNSANFSSTRALDRPGTVRVHSNNQRGNAPPGAGYFIVGVQLSLRDLSPSQLLPVFGPLTNGMFCK